MEEPGSPQENKADALLALARGPLAASAARLSAHSRAVPAGRDFHFYRNFDEFGAPAKELASRSEALLTSIVSSEIIGGKLGDSAGHPEDLEDAHDWVVLLNDELLEQFGASMDEFRRLKMEEESGTAADKAAEMEAGGFRIVQSRKNKKNRNNGGVDETLEAGSPLGVKVASRDKRTNGPRSQVPFHIASIPRPQDTFKILVNNSNHPFEHVWLERSEDGSQFVHPLEKLSVINFIDRNIGKDEPMKPPPISDTPFKFVEEVKDLKELASKLRAVDEFAVDLEHNQYRSFQGLTCLMQISTRTEDFLVDTLKLRIHIGPHLREVFKDPSKRKVMHGADRDILWLQRDFGIYVCNLFDTGQASRVLQLERNSLEFLLQHFCEVTANKEYQQADWRLRPLPEEMIKYAREDTHYLLYIYDVMRRQLISQSSVSDPSDSLLAEVYRRSSDICLQLYEKELLTESSYLRIYGLSETDFNPRQIAIVAGLWEWRDYVARAEDESTGYILPNKALLEIARQMPMTCGMLRKLVKSKHPYVEQNLESVISVIKNAVVNAASFEPIVEYLKNSRLEMRNGGTDSTATATDRLPVKQSTIAVNGGVVESKADPLTLTNIAEVKESPKPVSVNAVLVQRKEKPAGAFGALFGAPSIKRKLTPESLKVNAGQGEVNSKVEQIRSSVALPFRPFSGGITLPAGRQLSASAEPPVDPGPATSEQTEDVVQQADRVAEQGEDIILLAEERSSPAAATGHWEDFIEVVERTPLSGEEQTAPPAAARRWEPFDYAAARKEVKFGDRREERASTGNSTGSGGSSSGGGPAVSEFSAPRRCQAYPASGNRSATFR